MTTTRYFKFTDGTDTYFRASKTRVYASGQYARGYITFSGKPATTDWHPAVEITKGEYEELVALKTARLARTGSRFTVPSDSWVANSELAG